MMLCGIVIPVVKSRSRTELLFDPLICCGTFTSGLGLLLQELLLPCPRLVGTGGLSPSGVGRCPFALLLMCRAVHLFVVGG